MSAANDIKIGKVSQVLAIRDIEKGIEKDLSLPRKLYTTRKGVEWALANSDSSLTKKQGYMIAMCGKYTAEARGILALGATGQNVSAIYGSGSVLMPYPINLTITAGQSGVYTLSNLAWIGLQSVNTVVINNASFQSGVGFTFNSATGQFDFTIGSYLLQTGDVLTTLGFKTVASGTISGGGGSTTPTTIYVTATDGLTLSVPITVGKTVTLLLRGGIGAQVITTGSPSSSQVFFDGTVGSFSVPSGSDFVSGENITIQYY